MMYNTCMSETAWYSNMALTALPRAYNKFVAHAPLAIMDSVNMESSLAHNLLAAGGVKKCCCTNSNSSAFLPASAICRLCCWNHRRLLSMPSYDMSHNHRTASSLSVQGLSGCSSWRLYVH